MVNHIKLLEIAATAKNFEMFKAKYGKDVSDEQLKSIFDRFAKQQSRLQIKDIFKYGSLKDLTSALETKSGKEVEKSIKTSEANILVNNEKMMIVEPLTMAASLKYGANTKWCTTYSDPEEKNCLKINILALNTNPNFRKFLNEFFYSLIYRYKSEIPDAEIQNISKIVDTILTNKCDKLAEAIKLFDNDETKKIYEILKFWQDSGLVKIFDYDREINWSDRTMGFDLSEYGDKDFILVPILYYILYLIV